MDTFTMKKLKSYIDLQIFTIEIGIDFIRSNFTDKATQTYAGLTIPIEENTKAEDLMVALNDALHKIKRAWINFKNDKPVDKEIPNTELIKKLIYELGNAQTAAKILAHSYHTDSTPPRHIVENYLKLPVKLPYIEGVDITKCR